MADIFTVLYVTNVAGIAIPEYGVLVAVQLATAILVYIPSAKIADRLGRNPLVIATFVCFALFPVAVVLAKSFAWLVGGAFVIGACIELRWALISGPATCSTTSIKLEASIRAWFSSRIGWWTRMWQERNRLDNPAATATLALPCRIVRIRWEGNSNEGKLGRTSTLKWDS